MNNWTKNAGRVTLLAAGFLAVGSGIASADTTNGDSSVAGGNQVTAPISVPITVSGNAVALLGKATAKSAGWADVTPLAGDTGMTTSGKNSVGGGNQVRMPITMPITFCGNAIGLVGEAQAAGGCHAPATVPGVGGTGGKTNGKFSVFGGNQVTAPVTAPVNVSCNAVSLHGSATSAADCSGSKTVASGSADLAAIPGKISGEFGLSSVTQTDTPASAPAKACANSASALGNSASASALGNSASAVGDSASAVGNSDAMNAPEVRPVGASAADQTLPQTTRKSGLIQRFRKALGMSGERTRQRATESAQNTAGSDTALPNPLGLGNQAPIGRGLPLTLAGVPLLSQG